jgi:uncharacterized membrane protein YjfL (UPF0719 family)
MANDIKESVSLSLNQTGFDKGSADLRSYEGAERRAADGAELLARAQNVVERSTTRLGSRIAAFARSEMTEAERVLKRMTDGQALLETAQRRGLPVPDQMASTMARLNERYQRLTAESRGAAGAMALTRMESLALTYTFNDVVASLSSGISPMTIVMQQGGQVTQAFGGLRQTLEKLLPVLARYAAAGTAAGVVAAAFYEVISTYGEIQKINEGAASAGVSTDLFQIWLKHATALRIEAKAAEDAIIHAGKTLAGQVENFSALSLDSGQSRVTLRANNLSDVLGRDTRAKEMAAEARSLDDMHRAALQLVQDYYDASRELEAQGRSLDAAEAKTQAIQTATEVWGDAGRKVAEGIANGTLNIDEFAKKSSETSNIWSEEILNAQKEVDRMLGEANKHLGDVTIRSEEFAKICISIQGAWGDIVQKIANSVDLTGKMVKEWDKISATPWVWRAMQLGLDSASDMSRGASTTRPMTGRLIQIGDVTSEGRSIDDLQTSIPLPPERPSGLGTQAPRARRARAERSDEAERYVESLSKSVEVLQAEADAIGKSNREREIAIDLARAEEEAKKANRVLTEEEIANITRLAERRVELNKRIEGARESTRAANDQTRFFGEQALASIEGAILSAQRLDQVMQNVASAIAKAALQAALLGEGPLAGLFGTKGENGAAGGLAGLLAGGAKSLFAGFFDDGGTIMPGHFGVVGERRPELAFAGSTPLNIVPLSVAAAGAQRATGAAGAPIYMSFQNAPPVARQEERRTASGGRRIETVFAEQTAAALNSPMGQRALSGRKLRPI